ncbi:MAG: DUF3786 domain-containing protein [Phycisphaerae bacterium]|nr:DUF3786 domain-containing protein [Phycisphaerae bacterium]
MVDSQRLPLPEQNNLIIAVTRGLEALRDQGEEMLGWLGADRDEQGRIRVPVFNRAVSVDFEGGGLVFADGSPVDMRWQVFVIHYLCAGGAVEATGDEMVFADIPETRGYQGVYDGRVIKRLCFTVGRSAGTLEPAAVAVGGERCEGEGDLNFRFRALPRIPVRLVWYAGDEDFPPNAVFLFQSNVVQLLCPEDIIVLSESIVGAMSRAGR